MLSDHQYMHGRGAGCEILVILAILVAAALPGACARWRIIVRLGDCVRHVRTLARHARCALAAAGGRAVLCRTEERTILAANEVVYNGRRIRVERQAVPGTDGGERWYDLVVHPGAAVVLPVLADGRVLLIRNYRFAVAQTLLELPAGTLDDGEPALECARRELAEETGYRAGKLEPLVSFYSSPGFCDERLEAFLATELVLGETAREVGERIENTPMEYEEALTAIGDGRIMDGKTIAALLYYDRYVRARK